jgi:hypothetical protein
MQGGFVPPSFGCGSLGPRSGRVAAVPYPPSRPPAIVISCIGVRNCGTITAESFDKQVARKMGRFFDDVFVPSLKNPVEAGLSYDEVKRLVKIPTTWGAPGG